MSASAVSVRERPILFSGPMVRPTLADLKTQTRRTRGLGQVNACPDEWEFDRWQDGYRDGRPRAVFLYAGEPVGLLCPYGEPGDRLWVRETFAINPDVPSMGHTPRLAAHHRRCRADGTRPWLRWTPSIFMPRWASRITLEITGVRVERVQDISEEDVRAEGVEPCPDCDAYILLHKDGEDHWDRREYAALWDSLNASRGYGWDVNPWVWVLEFRQVTP